MAGTTFIKKVVIGTPIKRVQETLNIGDFRNFDTTGRQDGYILVWDSANANFVPRDSASLEILKVTDRITSNSGANLVLDPGGDNAVTGKVIILGDLQIDGTETIINSTTLSINDKNIILADSAADSAAANGAGLTIEGANATITYDATRDQFISNKGFKFHDSSDFNKLTARKINVTDGGPTYAAGDSASLTIGSNDDLVFYHDGDTSPSYKRGSYIVNGSDHFYIYNKPTANYPTSSNKNLYIENYSEAGYVIIRATNYVGGDVNDWRTSNYFTADPYNGEVSLFYGKDGVLGGIKLQTKSHGIDITGKLNVDSAVISGNLDVGGAFTTITTTGLTEGNNLYYTTARADSDARHAISAAGDLSYNSSTGVFSFDVEQVYTKANFDSDFNMSIDEASLGGVGIAYDATTNTLSIDSAELESNYKQDIRGYFTAGGDLSYNAATGNFSFDVEQVYTKSNFDSDLGAALDGGTGITYDSSNDTISITNTGVTAATYGSTTQIPKFTVNAQGQIDSAGFVTPATVTGFTWDSATSVATISTADNQTFPLPIRGFGDDQKLNFGDANEASIRHTNSGTTIFEAGAMEFDIDGAKQLLIKNNAGGSKIAEFHTFGAVDLYHGSIQRFATDSYGSTIFGRLIADSATFTNVTGTLQTAAQPNVTSLGTLTGLTSSGDVILDSAGAIMFDKSDQALEFGDDYKASFGAGGDLVIRHQKSNNTSYIEEGGTGDLVIKGDDVYIQNAAGTENMAVFVEDGGVQLKFNNATKLQTNLYGTTVTGKINADSATFTNITGTLQTAAQPNVTSLGTLTGLTSAGDVIFDSAGAIMFDKSDKSLKFADEFVAKFGSADDFTISHNELGTSQTRLTNNTGDVVFSNNADNAGIHLRTDNGSGGVATYVHADGSTGQVNLNHYGSLRFNTDSMGATVTGRLSADSATTDIFTNTGIIKLHNASNSHIEYKSSNGLNGYKLISGGMDLNDSGFSIKDLQGRKIANFQSGGGTNLFYAATGSNSLLKLATTKYGIQVYNTSGGDGNVIADSATFTNITTGTATADTFGDGSIYSISSDSDNISGTTTTAINTFAVATTSTRKYLATVTNGSKLQSSEMLLIGNTTNAYLTTYAVVNTDSNLGSFTADLNSGSARLKFTPTLAGTTIIKLMFTDISV